MLDLLAKKPGKFPPPSMVTPIPSMMRAIPEGYKFKIGSIPCKGIVEGPSWIFTVT
jgi:hypothetical protein